jgi:alkaline phosphatase D
MTMNKTTISLLCMILLLIAPAAAQQPKTSRPIERIAFGSCADQEKPQPIWAAIRAAKPDILLSLGDLVYVNRGGEDHAARLAAYRKLAANADFSALRDQIPFLATWDDGELGINDGGANFPRLEDFRKDFLDFLGEPPDSARRKSGGVYDARIFGPPGKSVQVILLDTRSFRSPLKRGSFPPDGGRYVPDAHPQKTMLGEAQWKWLEEQLRVPATIRLIISSIQVVPEEQRWESWSNFPHERKRLFDLIRAAKVTGAIFLSGDRHLAELSVVDGGAGYPFFDLTSSGWNVARIRQMPHEPNRHRVVTVQWTDNFGMIEIDWTPPDPQLALQIRGAGGEIVFQRKLALSLLQPGALK